MTPTVLAIDDSVEVLAALKAFLRPEGVNLRTARDWESGLELAAESSPDLILLDVCMPDQSGLDVCRRLKNDPHTANIPIIFLTAVTDLSTKLHGFDLGATDYITKPFHPEELRARVRTALRQQRERTALRQEARIDALTGLLNRAAFDRELQGAFGACLPTGSELSLVLVDLDHFKTLNDRFGHQFGDEVLSRVGATLRHETRPTDHACRYGGEELALILPGVDLAGAEGIAERMRVRIASLPFFFGSKSVQVTASFGVSSRITCADDDTNVALGAARLISAADLALYSAKRHGRDRVCTSVSALAQAS